MVHKIVPYAYGMYHTGMVYNMRMVQNIIILLLLLLLIIPFQYNRIVKYYHLWTYMYQNYGFRGSMNILELNS